MSIGKSREFEPSVLPAGKLAAAIRAALDTASLSSEPKDPQLYMDRRLADKSQQSLAGLALSEIDGICDLAEPKLSIRTGVGTPDIDWHYIGVYGGEPGLASVNVVAPTGAAAERMLDAFMEATGLVPHVVPPADDDELTEIQAPSAATRHVAPDPGDPRLRAFIAHRFAPENEAAALALQRFLDLLNVEVLTGRSYEPRSVSEKVSDRLAGLDFLVLIVGLDGESLWTRDEIATARAGGVYVVPLVAEGALFAGGLFGDLEYISYSPGHIGDAFLSVLEAVVFVRRARS